MKQKNKNGFIESSLTFSVFLKYINHMFENPSEMAKETIDIIIYGFVNV